MFTPHRVSGGPGKEVALNRIRITKGTYISFGESFEIIDDYSIGSSAHRLLARGWVGTTEFRELDQQIRVIPTEEASSRALEALGRTRDPCRQSMTWIGGIAGSSELAKPLAWADMESEEEEADGVEHRRLQRQRPDHHHESEVRRE